MEDDPRHPALRIVETGKYATGSELSLAGYVEEDGAQKVMFVTAPSAGLATDGVRAARDWLNRWLELYAERHACAPEPSDQAAYRARQDGHGPAVTSCTEDEQGRFWAGNDEYGSWVKFCPFCGAKSPVAPPE